MQDSSDITSEDKEESNEKDRLPIPPRINSTQLLSQDDSDGMEFNQESSASVSAFPIASQSFAGGLDDLDLDDDEAWDSDTVDDEEGASIRPLINLNANMEIEKCIPTSRMIPGTASSDTATAQRQPTLPPLPPLPSLQLKGTQSISSLEMDRIAACLPQIVGLPGPFSRVGEPQPLDSLPSRLRPLFAPPFSRAGPQDAALRDTTRTLVRFSPAWGAAHVNFAHGLSRSRDQHRLRSFLSMYFSELSHAGQAEADDDAAFLRDRRHLVMQSSHLLYLAGECLPPDSVLLIDHYAHILRSLLPSDDTCALWVTARELTASAHRMRGISEDKRSSILLQLSSLVSDLLGRLERRWGRDVVTVDEDGSVSISLPPDIAQASSQIISSVELASQADTIPPLETSPVFELVVAACCLTTLQILSLEDVSPLTTGDFSPQDRDVHSFGSTDGVSYGVIPVEDVSVSSSPYPSLGDGGAGAGFPQSPSSFGGSIGSEDPTIQMVERHSRNNPER
eukprot:gnl/Dysnectes_brevis/8116_a14239_201.p1 GENE.gnl/Dysnectes_brevis/8116_a14239_201~~gnl/Dysnectes_brevis/8116_a14239_201.p1  ORF type:complete len:508 (+),score=123.37 gnl/Dysnectes_brevis/8116_a14239_201:113-1636(+)